MPEKTSVLKKLSVIIVNYRGWESLKLCLDSLSCLKSAGFGWEVIIVDNFSDDGRMDEFALSYPDFRFIENKGNYGFSNGNNLGAAYAGGEYFLFLNPDTIVSLEALSSMLHLAEEHPVYHIVSIQQRRQSGKPENPFGIFPSVWTINGLIRIGYSLFSKKKFKKDCKTNPVILPDWVSGSVVLIKRQVFEQTGGWSEDFWLYYEDIDLCRRVRDRGGRIALLCDISITHHHGSLTRKDKKRIAFFKAEVMKSRHIYFYKHYKRGQQIILQSFLVINTLFFEELIPAMIGLIFFPFLKARVHLFIYIYLWEYYFQVMKKKSWILRS